MKEALHNKRRVRKSDERSIKTSLLVHIDFKFIDVRSILVLRMGKARSSGHGVSCASSGQHWYLAEKVHRLYAQHFLSNEAAVRIKVHKSFIFVDLKLLQEGVCSIDRK
jgi:hypothetical protein